MKTFIQARKFIPILFFSFFQTFGLAFQPNGFGFRLELRASIANIYHTAAKMPPTSHVRFYVRLNKCQLIY